MGLAWRGHSYCGAPRPCLDPVEQRRISGAIPTVQRLGYALGAAYIGIIANAAGMAFMSTPSDGIRVAEFVFLSCLPLAAVGVHGHADVGPTTVLRRLVVPNRVIILVIIQPLGGRRSLHLSCQAA